jgi:hypothetical protein
MKKTMLLPLVLAIAGTTSFAAPASVADLNKMTKRFAPVELKADSAKLSAGDKKAIAKLIEAAKIVDVLQLRQRWSQTRRCGPRCRKTPRRWARRA